MESPDCVINIQGNVGDTISIQLVLYNVTGGVSGFIIEVSAANPDVVDFVDVQHPGYQPPGFPPVFDITNSDQEASVDFQAIDLIHLLEGDFDEMTLATISAELKNTGTTDLIVNVLAVEDDSANILLENFETTSTLTVN